MDAVTRARVADIERKLIDMTAEFLNIGVPTPKQLQDQRASVARLRGEQDRLLGISASKWVTVAGAMQYYGVTRRTIYNWISGGKLEVRKTPGGSPRILAEGLD